MDVFSNSPSAHKIASPLDYGALWQLPSDHLPVGAKIGDTAIASWNVLNTAYISHLKRNEQGLADSILIADNRPTPDSPLTVRERATLDLVHKALPSLHAFFLQECGPTFIHTLVQELPENWKLVTGRRSPSTNDIVALIDFNHARIDTMRSEQIEAAYPRCRALESNMERPIMNLLLRLSSGDELRVIHSHVPGNPNHPGVLDFAEYVRPFVTNGRERLLVLGDLNFTEETVQAEFTTQGIGPFRNLQPLNSIVGNDRNPKRIDHLLYFDTRLIPSNLSPLFPETFGAAAAATARLLNPNAGL